LQVFQGFELASTRSFFLSDIFPIPKIIAEELRRNGGSLHLSLKKRRQRQAGEEFQTTAQAGCKPGRAAEEGESLMKANETTNFKATALSDETLRQQAPSIYASGPMAGVSSRYTFVPTARIVDGLREQDWVPVDVEEQRIRKEARRGFQKHLIRFRRAGQMQTLDEWNVELVLLNSHDRGCAYQLHAGIYRRICSNGLVMSLC
jgi:hypothetical protein